MVQEISKPIAHSSPLEAVRSALVLLAGQCDGAVDEDAVGFNGADSELGRSLAKQIEGGSKLTERQLRTAAKMLQKYRNTQLSSIALPTVEEVDRFLVSGIDVETEQRINTVPMSRKLVKRSDRDAAAVVEVEASPVEAVSELKPWLTSRWREGLNEQQQLAFDLCHEWFFAPDGVSEPFVLTGKPGVGKSYTAQRIAKSIGEIYQAEKERSLKMALTAPTHRARAILESFAGAIGLNCHIATMHSLLHLMPGKADHNGRIPLVENSWSQELHWGEFGLVIGDEQSMTGKELFKFIPKGIPTILMGDQRQLPPVENPDQAEQLNTLELSPVFSLPSGVNLTKVMRFDGQLAYYVDAIADAIDEGSQFLPPITKFETRTGNLLRISSQDTWEFEMIETFKAADLQVNPNEVRALAWTNKRVNELNNMIRYALTGVSPEQVPFMKGDRVMAKEPVFRKVETEWGIKNQILMQTCSEGVVQNVIPDFIRFEGENVAVNWIAVKTDEGTVADIMTLHPDSFEFVKGVIANQRKLAMAAEEKSEKSKHWRQFYDMLETFNLVSKGALMQRLQYAFASTCHQAQGGTYDYIFSDHQNLMQCRTPTIRSRLIYVASSRAAKQLIAYAKY